MLKSCRSLMVTRLVFPVPSNTGVVGQTYQMLQSSFNKVALLDMSTGLLARNV